MIKLLKGDCLQLMAGMPDNSVDMVCCDMPYGTTKCRWDTTICLETLWLHYNRVVKPDGAIILFAQTPFDKVLGSSNLKHLRYELVWEKSHPTGHLNARKMPLKAHENIMVFYRSLPVYNPIFTQGHPRKVATKRKDESPVYGAQKIDSITYDSTERYPRSVLKFPSDKQKSNLHPTQKPVALIEWLVKTYSNPGDVVLDNAMGSGTTGVACKNLGRRFIGIELDDHFYKVAKDRIDAA